MAEAEHKEVRDPNWACVTEKDYEDAGLIKWFAKISRGNQSYIQPIEELHNAVDGELDGQDPEDNDLVITFVRMSAWEYAKLPEFQGW